MSAPMYAHPNDSQMMMAQRGVQAREVQVSPQYGVSSSASVQPQMPGFAPAAPSTVDQDMALDQRIRRRVVCISAIIAVYVVINAVLQYVFDVATIQDTLDKVREVIHFKGGPTMTRLLLNAIPSVGTSIIIGLLVPLCGYLGVKQNQQALVGCFCGCNFFSCCCGILTVASLIFLMFGAQAMAPGVEDFLTRCDPMQCVPVDKVNRTNEALITDCLAAGTWEDYKPQLGTHSYRQGCLPVFLRCGHEREEPEESFSEPPASVEVMDEDGFTNLEPPTVGATNSMLGSARRLPVVSQYQRLPRRLRSVWAEQSTSMPAVERQRHAFPWLKAGTSHRAADLEHRKRMGPPPKPRDVLAECAPAKLAMKRFHQIRLLVPELLPQLTLFIIVRIILILPVVALGCLGFCWGKDLFQRLQQGYTQISSQSALQPQQVISMQPSPALATAGAQTLTTLTSAQPLLLHAPPVPPVARSEQTPTDDRGDTQSLLQNAASNDAATPEASAPSL